MQIITIPDYLRSNQEGFNFLSSLFGYYPNENSERLSIDFSKCRNFSGNLAAALGAILDELTARGFAVFLSRPKGEGVRKTLGRIRFLQAWLVETTVEDKENYIEYKRFESTGSPDDFKSYVDYGLIKKQKFPLHTEGVAASIVENIYEIFVNAITHGESKYVYSCGEYKREAGMLEMTIVDCGVSIPENVNTFLSSKNLQTLETCDAIKWAFVSGNTTKDHTGGLGLAILKEFIEMNKGAIQVVSGYGMIEYKDGMVDTKNLEVPFAGTVVNMKFNFNDKMKYCLTTEVENLNINDLL